MKSKSTTPSPKHPVVPVACDEGDVKIASHGDTAAGIPAVVNSLRHAAMYMGAGETMSSFLKVNKPGGFDCPSCAWPDPEDRHPAEFCENGAKAIAEEATSRRVRAAFFRNWSVEELSEQSAFWLGKRGRLTTPMVLEEGATHYTPISWDGAFAMIGEHLRGLSSPDEAIFYTSGRTSNEAAFVYQLFVRAFGTNNLPDCSNMCHESSGKGLSEAIGVGKGTVTLQDLYGADTILVIGQNPGTNHPRMLTALQRAAQNGCRIISINPLKEKGLTRFKHPQDPTDLLPGGGTQLAERFVRVRIGGDIALLKGVMKCLLEAEENDPMCGAVDRAFIKEHTHGFEEVERDLHATSWDDIERSSGVARAEIQAVARAVMSGPNMIICWAMGLTQHVHAVGNIQSVVNLLLMRGSIGKPNAGACPVRGHSNVQGDRTMGIWEKLPPFVEALEDEFSIQVPRKEGWGTTDAIQAMLDGKARVFFGMGGNFVTAAPDTERTAQAMRSCDLTVHVSTKLNRSHLVHGKRALILPCLGRTDLDVQASGPQFVSCENSMGIVQKSQGHLEPPSPHLLSEVAILTRLARATLGADHPIDWEGLCASYDTIRDHISHVVPGFHSYNTRVRRRNGFVLPNAARDRVFETSTGKANFFVHPIPDLTLEDDRFLLMTIRSHDQFNTTIYGHEDRYRGLSGNRRVLLIHPKDLARHGLKAGERVDIVSHFRGETRRAVAFVLVPYEIPTGCIAAYFPEANAVVPLHQRDPKSHTPASKSVVCSLERSTWEAA